VKHSPQTDLRGSLGYALTIDSVGDWAHGEHDRRAIGVIRRETAIFAPIAPH
jgi:hypothetical protein